MNHRTHLARALAAPSCAALLALASFGRVAADDHGGHGHAHAGPIERPSFAAAGADRRRARAAIPPPPAGITDVELDELFDPIGAGGLSYSEKLRGLDGRLVRILGYMVSQDQPVPGTMLVAPFPFQLHESEYGFAEDLPPATVHVIVPDRKDAIVPFTPGLLLLTGTVRIGPREEPDGRISTVRLELVPPAEKRSTRSTKRRKDR